MREITVKTDRHTQLIDITSQVREALDGQTGAAVLVYVPHTTAGVTINEHADPLVARDLRRGQVGVARVDLLEVERLLVAGVVEVVLLVQLRDEAVRLLAVGVQLSRVHPP